MRMRTTFAAIMLAGLAGTALIVTSCSPDSTSPLAAPATDAAVSPQKLDDLRAKYGWVGQYHTDGLAFVYARLVQNRKSIHGKADACREAARALKEFHRTARKGDVPFGLVDPSISAEVCGTGGPGISRDMSIDPTAMRIRGDGLSLRANDYLNRIISAVEGATSMSGLMNDIYGIELEASYTLPESEAGAVSAIASIAYSSAEYWDRNLTDWVTLNPAELLYARSVDGSGNSAKAPSFSLTNPLGVLPPRWFSDPFVKNYLLVLGADVTAGARTAYLAWAAGPIGWEAAAASALWASATTALYLFFK